MDDETRGAFARMERETRAAFARMERETRAGFGRIDRYFELAQVQHAELRADFGRLDKRLGGVEDRLSALEATFRSFRDWVTEQFAELRGAIQQLTVRIEILERRQLR